MANAITFAVVGSDNVSKLAYLMQDEATPTTIHGVFGGSPHDLTGCAASADGTAVSGSTKLFFMDAAIEITIAPSRVSIVAPVVGDVGGAVSAADYTSLLAFVLACKLPLIATA